MYVSSVDESLYEKLSVKGHRIEPTTRHYLLTFSIPGETCSKPLGVGPFLTMGWVGDFLGTLGGLRRIRVDGTPTSRGST